MSEPSADGPLPHIAIVGMAGRFPGADEVASLWRNLLDGVDALEALSDEELAAAGVDAALLNDPAYVKAARVLAGVECFDHAYFGLTPREAQVMDPQLRLLLQCAQHCFEDAGYVPGTRKDIVGVYAGTGFNRYLIEHVLPNADVLQALGPMAVQLGNDRDFAATQIAYRFDLRGPAVSVSTACSTSLVAVHQAVQSLLAFDCDLALAGGASVAPKQRVGYRYEPGGIASPDGRCRAFDADACGTSHGSGVGLVLLRRLEDALEAGQRIHAVLRATAINNDGADKVGFTAPSVTGQARAIRDALALAEVEATDVGYVEAHGTATPLGDPIEIAALHSAFGDCGTARCSIGSVKSNVGHLDAAAGVTGLIKAALTVKHAQVPPSLHFHAPNPELGLDDGPFEVCAASRPWQGPEPRIAGVSSFGMGGTNAHAIVEQPPARAVAQAVTGDWQLLPLSATDDEALGRVAARYRDFFAHCDSALTDVAFSLQENRRALAWRGYVVARDSDEAAAKLTQPLAGVARHDRRLPIAFLFPGQGSETLAMAGGLYRRFPAYREAIDACLNGLEDPEAVAAWLFANEIDSGAEASEGVTERSTRSIQPALFCHQHALACLWRAAGACPDAVIGHSLGEIVAACQAGVMSLADALRLVEIRGELMQTMPPGAMLAVSTDESSLRARLGSALSLAAVNAEARCVVAGDVSAIEGLERDLRAMDVACRRLPMSRAFHSPMVEPVMDRFRATLEDMALHAPHIPMISNVTGDWLNANEATSPDYWCRHMRHPVRFADGAATLMRDGPRMLIETGPGRTLATLAMAAGARPEHVVAGVGGGEAAVPDWLDRVGAWWSAGGQPRWSAVQQPPVQSVELPLYPFAEHRAWLEPRRMSTQPLDAQPSGATVYRPTWRRRRKATAARLEEPRHWLVLADSAGVGAGIASGLRDLGQTVTVVGAHNGEAAVERSMQDPSADAFSELLGAIDEPTAIVDCWPLDCDVGDDARRWTLDALGYLAQALQRRPRQGLLDLAVVTDGALDVVGADCRQPWQAMAHAPAKVMQQEMPGIRSLILDVDLSEHAPEAVARDVVAELGSEPREPVRALRGGGCWVPGFDAESQASEAPSLVRENGAYLITGGWGRMGLLLAQWLADRGAKRLVLVGRSPLPPRSEWVETAESPAADSAMRERLQALIALERRVERLDLIEGGIEDTDSAQRRIAEAEAVGGALDGVFHCAARLDDATLAPIEAFDAEATLAQLPVKVSAAAGIAEAARARDWDFVALMSSLSAVVAGLGHTVYAAANAYLDALAAREDNHRTRWLAIDWDGWDFEGHSGTPAIRPEQAPALFDAVVRDRGIARVAVSCTPLTERMDRWLSDCSAVQPEPKTEAAPPRSTLEALTRCWRELLGVDELGDNADFFELGGDSLAAVRLVGTIQQRMGIAVRVAELYEHPKLRDLAAHLDARQASVKQAPLVTLRRGEGEPILFVHPGGGGVAVYEALSAALSTPRPCLAVRAPGLDGGGAAQVYEDLPAMAQDYAAAISAELTARSVVLVGYCFGGLIAHAMAETLPEAGIDVERLILLNAAHPGLRESLPDDRAVRLAEIFGDLDGIDVASLRALSPEEQARAVVASARAAGKLPAEIDDAQARAYVELTDNHLELELAYRPRPGGLRSSGMAPCLVRAQDDRRFGDRHPWLGWRSLAGIEPPMVSVPGDHESMLKAPHVSAVAACIDQWLAAADSRRVAGD